MIHLGTGHSKTIDYSVLEMDSLRRLVEQGLTDREIAERAHCCHDTVLAWRRVWRITRRHPRKAKPVHRLTFADILDIGARVCRQRLGRCWDQCPHADDCDDEACRYDPKEDASHDPFWD